MCHSVQSANRRSCEVTLRAASNPYIRSGRGDLPIAARVSGSTSHSSHFRVHANKSSAEARSAKLTREIARAMPREPTVGRRRESADRRDSMAGFGLLTEWYEKCGCRVVASQCGLARISAILNGAIES